MYERSMCDMFQQSEETLVIRVVEVPFYRAVGGDLETICTYGIQVCECRFLCFLGYRIEKIFNKAYTYI